jgi:hypothetical protein
MQTEEGGAPPASVAQQLLHRPEPLAPTRGGRGGGGEAAAAWGRRRPDVVKEVAAVEYCCST